MEHLLPAVRDIASLSATERMTYLHHDCWIGYDQAGKALAKLESLLHFPRRVRMPNLLIIGSTNNGKTMIVQRFRRLHPPRLSDNGNHEIIPVIVMQMPSEPGIRRFYLSLLAALNMPYACSNSVAQLENTALKILRIVEPRMLIIDELHNLLAGNASRQREFLNLLRFIGNELQLPIVGVGIKEAYLAIRNDDQLENRFEPLVLPVWQDNAEFRRLLVSFEAVLPLQKPSHLSSRSIRQQILSRSDGVIGEIVTLLRQAACQALLMSREYIDEEILQKTHYHGPHDRRRLCEAVLV